MKQFAKKAILSVLLLSFFLAPFSATLEIRNGKNIAVNLGVRKNEIKAQASNPPADEKGHCTSVNPKPAFTLPQLQTHKECTDRSSGQNIYEWTPVGEPLPTENSVSRDAEKQFDYGCSLFSPVNCAVMIVHKVFFGLMSLLAEWSAYVMDFTMKYAINHTAYTSSFITEGWKLVRDIANIFFIIILFWIAMEIILGNHSHGANPKKLVGMVIVIGLIINFSLFTTRVVVDFSNILAKIFYNNVSVVDSDGKPAEEESGEKSISVALVSKFNPQVIVGTDFKVGDNATFFLGITLISILMMIFMIYTFMTVSFLFMSRVVSLWLLMIFSPIAFISYAAPFKMPDGFSHKEWWSKLFDNAMLAPIFLFLLYIVIKFTELLTLVPEDATKDGEFTYAVLKTLIPFFILYVLLDKAKDIAVKMSGEAGKLATKFGGAVTALTLGGVAGVGAQVLQKGVGGAATKLSESQWIKDKMKASQNFAFKEGSFMKKVLGEKGAAGAEKFVRKGYGFGVDKTQKLASRLGGASFDIRTAPLGLAATALDRVGFKVNESGWLKRDGGYKADRDRAIKERIERANAFKHNEFSADHETEEIHQADEDIQELNNTSGHAIHLIEDRQETARKNMRDRRYEFEKAEREMRKAQEVVDKSPTDEGAKEALEKAKEELRKKEEAYNDSVDNVNNLQAHRRNLKDAKGDDESLKQAEENKNKTKEVEEKEEKAFHEAEATLEKLKKEGKSKESAEYIAAEKALEARKRTYKKAETLAKQAEEILHAVEASRKLGSYTFFDHKTGETKTDYKSINGLEEHKEHLEHERGKKEVEVQKAYARYVERGEGVGSRIGAIIPELYTTLFTNGITSRQIDRHAARKIRTNAKHEAEKIEKKHAAHAAAHAETHEEPHAPTSGGDKAHGDHAH